MSMMTDMIARGWDNFLARPSGMLNLRFIIQPALASFLALRAGLKDAREGRSAFLWAAINKPEHRRELLHGGFKQLRVPLLVGTAFDLIYQIATHRWVYPLELIFTVTLLVLVPYLLLRGPVNRIARRFIGGGKETGARD